MAQFRRLAVTGALTITSVLLAILIRKLTPVNIYPLFLAVIFGSAWLYGFRYGSFSLVLYLVLAGLQRGRVVSHPGLWDPSVVMRIGVFCMTAMLLAWLASQLREARREAAEKLQNEAAMQERFRDLVESINDAFFGIDRDWRIVYSNEKASMINRVTRSAILSGKTIWEIFPHIVGTRFEEEYRGAMADRKAATFEAVDKVSGAYFHVRLYPTKDGISVFLHDISDRIRTETALAKSEERYRLFIRHSSEGICRIEFEEPLDPDMPEEDQIEAFYRYGWLAECNDAMARMYSYGSAGEMVGSRLSAMLVASDPKNVDHIRKLIASGYRLTDAETHKVDEEGQPHYFLNNLVGIVENGKVTRVWGTQREITDRRQLEEAQKKYAENLARSNEDLAQFAYAASHDLQEPLRTILSFSQMLTTRHKNELTADAAEYLDFIHLASTRMHSLIVDLLAFSRVVHSEEQALGTADCNNALEWAKLNLNAAIQDTGARIECSGLPVVQGDRSQIAQLIQNLVSNAIKYRSAETPEVEISAERRESQWVFRVRDNGMGIDPRFSARIFGIFTRLHGRKFPGTGIGLALCKRIVERHGGHIWVESEVGRGSSFFFTLRAVD
ncbi:MAG TPA: ATP-binding protein [Bryobacteraceae bacterium]|nr:ATP-binding protein [Bryobacteraceae bacterium]